LAFDWQWFSGSEEKIEMNAMGGSDISAHVAGASCGEKIAIRLCATSIIEEHSLHIWVSNTLDPAFKNAKRNEVMMPNRYTS
jgi:hypothetical protein